jgi:hypothetical protein
VKKLAKSSNGNQAQNKADISGLFVLPPTYVI